MSPAPVLWFTGLSGSGKSTIATALAKHWAALGILVEILDGDEIRKNLNFDLGFSEEDRRKNLLRIAFIAGLLSRNGIFVVVPTIAPFENVRLELRAQLPTYTEVFVDCSLEECRKRDPKGLYKKVDRGEIRGFTGVDAPYEVPRNPDVHLRTAELSLEGCIGEIDSAVSRLGYAIDF